MLVFLPCHFLSCHRLTDTIGIQRQLQGGKRPGTAVGRHQGLLGVHSAIRAFEGSRLRHGCSLPDVGGRDDDGNQPTRGTPGGKVGRQAGSQRFPRSRVAAPPPLQPLHNLCFVSGFSTHICVSRLVFDHSKPTTRVSYVPSVQGIDLDNYHVDDCVAKCGDRFSRPRHACLVEPKGASLSSCISLSLPCHLLCS